ncbi:hypothetical protein NSS71_11320 [Niallia sp. FSL W8-0951]|uniref:hypothetical protein n=1 Tax=Niallia sp. FSL W8-0951 TaxID=2954639 RepID=UPI0030FBFFB6
MELHEERKIKYDGLEIQVNIFLLDYHTQKFRVSVFYQKHQERAIFREGYDKEMVIDQAIEILKYKYPSGVMKII